MAKLSLRIDTDDDAVEALRSERLFDCRLSGVADIDQTAFDVVSQRTKLLYLGLDEVTDEFGREVRKLREIGEGGIDADCEHSCPRH